MTNVIRKATTEDMNKVEASAIRFCQRHDIDVETADSAVMAISFEDDNYIQTLWRGCLRRAVNEPHARTIAHGHIVY